MKRIIIAILCAALALQAGLALAKDDDRRRKPPTKVTEKLSAKVFEQIQKAQEAMEAKDLVTAEALINELGSKPDKLNDYEKGQMYNFLAAIHYEQGRIDDTIADYIAILKLENAPEQLRDNSLFRLAQLYFVQEDYAKAVKLLDRWMSLQTQSIRPEAYMLKAQAYYQQDKYAEAQEPIIAALKEAKQRGQGPKESWLALLRAVYYEQGEYQKAVKVLAQLVQRWPKPSYYLQLSGMLGLMGEQKGQLYVMHAAHQADMLENEFQILNMARLYMAEDAPFPAIEILEQGLKDGQIEESAQNLQLLAQAMSLAKESEAQIPVLEKAAQLSGDAKQYMYLGQAQIALYRWSDAAKSLQQALKIGGLDRPGSVYMQLGTAYYNQKAFSRAKQAFKEAGAFEDYATQAGQWVRFVNQEIKRVQALNGS